MNKLYERQIFVNGTAPDLSAVNLNLLTKAVDEIDDRVCDIIPADDYIELARQTREYAEQAEESAERAHTTEVVVTPVVTTGTHIADIKVNSTTTELYAPTGGGGVSASINGVALEGNKTSSQLGLADATQLTVGGSVQYLDYQDGKWGANTDPNRGADTFSPFNIGTDPVQIRTSSSWDAVNSKLVIEGDFSDKHYAIVEMKYASSSGQTTSAVPKDVSSYICAPANVSSTAQGYVASRSVLFEDDKLTINTPTWTNYGLLRNIWVI